ncbi:MAG TPA: type II toxin-antitoxin system VapC family toxin [Polyangiaceae bacterium]
MTLRYLLDTGTLSWVIAPVPSEVVVRRLAQYGARCAIAAPVWHELVYGSQRLPPGKRRNELETFLRDVVQPTFPVLSYDHAAAGWHGRERARLEKLGSPMPYVDGQIAAVASVNALVLVTTNTKDFARFEDLQLEDWTRSRRR